jgi:hypothetical protein
MKGDYALPMRYLVGAAHDPNEETSGMSFRPLQNAAAFAGLLSIAEAPIVKCPEPKSPAAPAGAGGGYDF